MATSKSASAPSKTATPHRFKFFRSGGVDQVTLERGADIAALKSLDRKLWVALSCPVKGLELDEKTLTLIDSDKDGRVRAPELLNAIDWTIARLTTPDELIGGATALPLTSISDATEEGKQLRACAKRVLAGLGKPDAQAIAVGHLDNTEKVLAKLEHNGDGVIPPGVVGDPDLKKLAGEIVATVGGVADRGGEVGVDAAKLDAFFAECAAFAAWWKKATDAGKEILPLGEATIAAYDAFIALKSKIDDFFARVHLASFDARTIDAIDKRQDELLTAASRGIVLDASVLEDLPIAKIEALKALPLDKGVNPAYVAAVSKLKSATIDPLVGKNKDSLSYQEWVALSAKLAPYTEWLTSKAGAVVESLGVQRIQHLLGSDTRARFSKLIEEDKNVSSDLAQIGNLERLVRYHRDLYRLLNNFVSFSDFYSRRKGIFQAGTLYLDGRSCELCIKVDSADGHAGLASLAKSYIAYCDCRRPSTSEKMMVACAFTAGDSDHLMVGRNGVFYDRKGNDWDATIVKILDNPISIGQAFWAPYKKLLRFIEEQAAKKAVAADSAATDKLQTSTLSAADAAKVGVAPPKPKIDVGVVAALGVAVGGITAAFSGVLNAFFSLGAWIPLGVLGVMLAISGPSVALAWLKLRQRNLGPILDGCGWAVNGRVKVNIPLGRALTDTAALPPGSERLLVDPYAEKRPMWPKLVILLAILGAAAYGQWKHQCLSKFWGKFTKSVEHLEKTEDKPADPPPAK